MERENAHPLHGHGVWHRHPLRGAKYHHFARPLCICRTACCFILHLSPGVLSYLTVDPAFIVLFPASLTFYCYLKGLMTGKIVWAIAMGLFFSLYTFFSFSSGFVALAHGIFFLIAWRWKIVTLTED